MRLLAFLIATLTFFSTVIAVDIQKSVVITYPPSTPDSVLDKAKTAIKDSGGVITHEYQLIKGFAAELGEKVLDTVTAWGKEYDALVEENQVVSAL